MRYLLTILLMIEAAIACATTTTINLLNNQSSALWENTDFQSGYMFTRTGEWKFYMIDEAQNKHVIDWYGQPSEGIFRIQDDTIWLFTFKEGCWQKVRGLTVLQTTDMELTVRLVDDIDGIWTPSHFEVHYQYLCSDTLRILDSEQWDKTWNPVYQQRQVFYDYSFPVYALKNKSIKRKLNEFVVHEKNENYSDTINLCIELYIEKQDKGVYLVANSLPLFSGQNISGVLNGVDVPVFIHDSDMNEMTFARMSKTATYSVCVQETKYQNGIKVYDLCDSYLSIAPLNSVRILLH